MNLMIMKEIIDETDYQNEGMLDNCPNCGTHYDQIDWEYQICHICGFNAEDQDTTVCSRAKYIAPTARTGIDRRLTLSTQR